jgi:putative transposase
MFDRNHARPVSRQAKPLGVSCSFVDYMPRPVPAKDLKLMCRLDELHLDDSFAGAQMLRDLLRCEAVDVGRRHVSTLMKRMGIEAIYRRPDIRFIRNFYAG